MAEVSVVGLMMLKDEWPRCALSISHALEGHVDALWVVDHESEAETRHGLTQLQRLWGERLHVLRLDGVGYRQEAIMAVLLETAGAGERDWIYIVDADEFMLARGGVSLRTILAGVDEETSAIRYPVENWISEREFDERSLDAYRSLVQRTVSNVFVPEGLEVVAAEIMAGNINYFDVPFSSKVVFRRNAAFWTASGAHGLKGASDIREMTLSNGDLRAVHLPFLTRKRLADRVEHGEALIKAGAPAYHAWQNQMIYRIAQDDDLEAFWERHSIGPESATNGHSRPTLRCDDAFSDAIEPTLERLFAYFGGRLDSPDECSQVPESTGQQTVVPFASATRITDLLQEMSDALSEGNRRVIAERDRAALQRDQIAAQRDQASAERDQVVVERDRAAAAESELGARLSELDRALEEAERLRVSAELAFRDLASSRGVRSLIAYRRRLEHLLPHGSRRRAVYQWLIRSRGTTRQHDPPRSTET